LRDAPLNEDVVVSIDAIKPILQSINWERIITRAVINAVRSYSSIKHERPRLLPPRVFRHYINLNLLKYVFRPVISYFALPYSSRLSTYLFSEMVYYRIDEIPLELWSDFASLMLRVATIRYKLPEEVAKVVIILAAQLRLVMKEWERDLIDLGEMVAKSMNLLKEE